MTDIRQIGRDELQRLLGEMDIESTVDSEGAVYVVFPGDEDMPHDVVFHFANDDHGWFGITAIADGFELSEDQIGKALAIANEFARRARLPKAMVMNRRFKVEQWTIFPAGTSDQFVKDFIELVLSMSWRFFEESKQLMTQK